MYLGMVGVVSELAAPVFLHIYTTPSLTIPAEVWGLTKGIRSGIIMSSRVQA